MKKLFTTVFVLLAVNSFAQIPNAGMENWTGYTANQISLDRPNSWYGSDEATCWADTGLFGFLINPEQQVFDSGNEHTGVSAARLESLPILASGNHLTAAISTSPFVYAGIAVLPVGSGIPVTERISYVYAWTLYDALADDDTGSIVITAYVQGTNGDSIVGTGTNDILPVANYTQIGTVVEYTDATVVPTSINITFYSSKNQIGGSDISRLWVDDISWSTASAKNVANEKVVKVYPNPSAGLISIYNTLNEEVTLAAFNVNGQQVAEKKFKGNDVLDLTAQASGLYFFTVTNSQGQTVQHGKLTIAK